MADRKVPDEPPMTLHRQLATLLAELLLCATLCGQGSASPAQPELIQVGPNILVSRDGDLPHVELMVAANPRNPKQLVGAAITATQPAGGWACKTYASLDGGSVWLDTTIPEQVEWGGGDPQVAFTDDGAALFANLTDARDEKGHMTVSVNVYRSEDGGRNWSRPVVAAAHADHPQIAVDYSGGPHRGRIYIAYLHGYPEYQVSVVHSDDGGRSFSAPAPAASGKGVIGINVTSIHVLSDGTLVVPYQDFDFHQHATPPKEATSNLWVATSQDGGETYSQPVKVAGMQERLQPALGGFAMLAADTSAGANRDHIYAAWSDYSSGQGRVMFTSSADRGHTWQPPRVLDGSGPAGSVQYQVQVAVNKDGVLGVSWFDTRAARDVAHYDEYFAASLDGGASFLKPVRVSSATSEMFGAGNMQIRPTTWHFEQAVRISFTSPATRWRAGGDYMGLAADAEGVFHLLWADSRSGTFQMWTAPVTVSRVAAGEQLREAASRRSDVTEKIEIITDPAHYDPATRELSMPVRLKNMTGEPLYPPIRVTATKFGSGEGEVWRDYAPEILNAGNGKTGPGAEFTFDNALGGLRSLAPEAITGPVTIRLKISDPEKIPDMHLKVTAASTPK
ncbi:MAG: exo-alpha-sialidase [Acidobacteria bacterium]|nr:exo-alpha-sialidase [Acidobacteriota bacterium]